jgi:hypothetical protein
MTREEKRKIRLQIQDLLDKCQNCKYVSVSFASIHICPKCPLGQKIQELGKQLDPKLVKDRKKKVMKPRKKTNGWTDEEIQFVIDNICNLSYKEMAKMLGRTEAAIRRKVADMRKTPMGQVRVAKLRKNGWTDEECQFIWENKGKLTYKEMGEILGRTASAVKNQLIRMRREKRLLHA